jgi:hypothetical protein
VTVRQIQIAAAVDGHALQVQETGLGPPAVHAPGLEPPSRGQIHEGAALGPVVPGPQLVQDPSHRLLPERLEGEHQQGGFSRNLGAGAVDPHPEGPAGAAHGGGEGAPARDLSRVAQTRVRQIPEAIPLPIQHRPDAVLAGPVGIDAFQAGDLDEQGERPPLRDGQLDRKDLHRHLGVGRHPGGQDQGRRKAAGRTQHAHDGLLPG